VRTLTNYLVAAVEEPTRGATRAARRRAERAHAAERRRRAERARAVRRRRLALAAAAACAFAIGAIVGASAGGGGRDPLASGGGAESARSGSTAGDGARAQSGTAKADAGRSATGRAEGATGGGRSAVGQGGTQSGAVAGGGGEAAVDRLPLDRQVGRLVVLRFKGARVPAYVRSALRAGRATGAILFHDNVRDPAQLRALTGTLRAAGGSGTLVAVDQEGGPIRILPWAPPARPAPAQGAAGTAGADARAGAAALRAAGVNVALAPVADVPRPGSVMADRALGSTPDAAAQAVAAAVRGWRAGGIAPAVKHFPGLGGARVNTDHGSVAIRRSRRELEADLVPFRAALRAGVPLVMVGHAVYPALDPDHIASQSRAIATGLLRTRLRFRGVSVTDSLEADAVRATGHVDDAAVASLRAGVDLMLTTGRGSAARVYRRLLAGAQRDPTLRARVRESAARVERLRAGVARPPGG
jgi:beta-N-acetylhexosaminidase